MKIIPSIDLLDGKSVRLVRGELSSAISYAKTPLEVAETYIGYGASRIHVIDLDGAFTGKMKNLPIIRDLAGRFPIQVGGGIRSEAQIRELLMLGVKKVVCSTLLLGDPDVAAAIKKKYYGQLIGSFDFKQGKLSYNGWTEQSELLFEQVTEDLTEVIVTDTGRDGTLTGPNLDLLRSLKSGCSVGIVAAGGIRDVMDLIALKRIGMEGAIIGKAFLEEKIPLRNGFRFEKLVD